MFINIVTLLVSALFTGAAIYINVVEHPARLKLDNTSMLQEWKFGIKRATIMQGSLAIITFILACISYIITDNQSWIIGGIIIIINWPYTLLVIMPTNKKLLSTNDNNIGDETKYLIKRWNKLHTVRTIFGITATVIFTFSLLAS